MRIFISGTDTNIGKTVISTWLALHSGFAYFKPIQTGIKTERDADMVQTLARVKIYPESYSYQEPLSPHLAAKLENDRIDMDQITLPQESDLIIEGAGGVLVPINEKYLIIDLIQKLDVPVIVVSRTSLGTINHSLLTLEALRSRNITVLGMIMNGESNIANKEAIEYYGRTSILAEVPRLEKISHDALTQLQLTDKLKSILGIK